MCLLDLLYVWFLLNHTYAAGINGIPIIKATGYTSGIILLLHFRFWQPVYYRVYDSDFPSHSMEKRCRWVGIAVHFVHATTFKVINDDTQKILFCSKICYSEEPMESNLPLEPPCGDPYPLVKSRTDRDKQSVSRFSDYSRKDEQDNSFLWMKKYLKTKLLEKLGRLMHP